MNSSFVRGLNYTEGRRCSSVVERRTRDRKVMGSIHGRSSGRSFFPRVKFLCRLILVSVPPPCHRSSTLEMSVIQRKSAGGRLQLNTQTPLNQIRSLLDPTKSELTSYAGQAWRVNLSGKRVRTQHVRERFSTVVSARRATLAWKKLNWWARWSPLEKKNSAGGNWFVEPSPIIFAYEEKAAHKN